MQYWAVWFYNDGIANILSLNNLKKKYQVIYESATNDCFEVHKKVGTQCVFMPSKWDYSTQVLMTMFYLL